MHRATAPTADELDADAPLFAQAAPDGGWISVPLVGPWLTLAPLSKREARDYREVLVAAISKYGELADEAIPLVSRTHAELTTPIWATLGEEEASIIADCFLDVGQRVGVVAQAVRGVARSFTYLEMALILGPRFVSTVQYYAANGIALSFRLGGGERKGR